MNADRQKCVRRAAIAALAFGLCAADVMAQTPEKQLDSFQTFYLKNATSQNAANDIQTAMRNLLPRARIYYANSENALMVSGSTEELAQAQKLLADLDKPQKIYRGTYTISDGHGPPKHVAVLVSPGRRTIAKQGTRVPIMTGSYKSDGADPANTQFQYVDIGLSIDASIEGYGDGLRLMSKIEETGISEQKSNVGIQDPVVDQSVLEAHSAVTSGKPMLLGSLDTSDGKHIEVQVVIEVMQ